MAPLCRLTTLPPELRERIYEYIAATHSTRRVQSHRSVDNTWTHQISTSAISLTCRLIHNEYEPIARKAIENLEFTTTEIDFSPVMDYFQQKVGVKYLATLQNKQVPIHIRFSELERYNVEVPEFCTWALFLIDAKLQERYSSSPATWMEIFESADLDALEEFAVPENSPEAVRKNINVIRARSVAFVRAVWKEYPSFSDMLQARRRRAWDQRELAAWRG